MKYGISEADALFIVLNQVCLECKQSAQVALSTFLHGVKHEETYVTAAPHCVLGRLVKDDIVQTLRDVGYNDGVCGRENRQKRNELYADLIKKCPEADVSGEDAIAEAFLL